MSTTESKEQQHAAASRRPTKNEKRRMKKKTTSKENDQDTDNHADDANLPQDEEKVDDHKHIEDEQEITVEYVAADYDSEAGMDRQLYEELKDVFKKFARPEELLVEKARVTEASEESQLVTTEDGTSADNQIVESKKLSRRKKKLMSRLTVSELKQLVSRPDVVEAHDVTSSDPRLLVCLKASRCTVPVPRHWCQIRKYLQGKRGVEKVPFQLPEFIADTGIAKIREAIMEQEAMKKGKQKARERIRPKMGKIDIDYQVLHDAFFKYQTKPKVTGHGDLYFEGKEFEVQMKEKIPGVISAELKTALGMQDNAPPPWLINMQRYGPPPAYTSLRIPGLNAALPPGASYGYQPGGWGKPPVDEYGRPLYGDVFGTADTTQGVNEEEVDKTYRWGGYEYEDEEEAAEEEDDEEEEEEEGQGGEDFSGLETPNSVDNQSLLAGLETPDTIDLRKRAGTETPDTQASRELYHVIQERKTTATGNQMFGSDRGYVLPGKSDVQMSINPEELEEMMNNKDKLKSMHEAQTLQNQNDIMFNKGRATNGTETEEDQTRGKKRKAEAPIIHKKVKEFKF